MIHSLSGGEIKDHASYNFALVEVLDRFGGKTLKLWYLCSNLFLKVGDKVLVPIGQKNIQEKGVVLRVEKGLTVGRTPIPIKMAKQIIKKLD